MADVSDELIEQVMGSLADDRYKWRTIRGVAKQVDAPEDMVRHIFKLKEEDIVQSSVPSTKGEDLFTLRETFSANTSLGSRFLGALKGRAR
ncbi:hypothetical protein [Kordiimonas sp.]|uniref:hypothetical protein n=1 Tax=Kordiimonas sp. TaxID=1970157 RepID=UPI003A8FE03F|eukprot:GDKH01016116.1.p2 GENE.GDKH01016116.1~~GDKH01016116.1.p2  ORF type:complete len:91 (+),score=21.89 GDKH01016116.1:83-355(+)